MQTDLTIILNTHMPYVLGSGNLFEEPENWLFEAITETYIPLLTALQEWKPERYPGKKIILCMTPCLLNQLINCKERYMRYLRIMQKIAVFETERTKSQALYNKYERWSGDLSEESMQCLHQSASIYLKRIDDALYFVENNDFVDFLKKIAEAKLSHVELWTSSPNHNFLPFFDKKTSNYFIRRGVDLFSEAFDRPPDGFWLPECAFRPGIEEGLLRAGIRQTALTPHAIEVYHPEIKSGVYRHGDLRLLIHDFRLAAHIWKTELDTFPSNPVYREFYRDMGLDVTENYFEDAEVDILASQHRAVWTGIKYHAITGYKTELGSKRIYSHEVAKSQAIVDAKAFFQILDAKRDLAYDRKNFILAFDTELFGHWWHEGVFWLECVMNNDFSETKKAYAYDKHP
jgi:1,4-alpha-glucan branching enzyme